MNFFDPNQKQYGSLVPNSQEDTIQQIKWSPNAHLFSAASWNGETRIWECNGENANPKTLISHEQKLPALTTCWHLDGTKVFSGGADKKGKLIDLNSNQTIQVAEHSAAIIGSAIAPGPNNMGPVLITCGYDKFLKFWDLKAPNPIFQYQFGSVCTALDVRSDLMVVALMDGKHSIFNLREPQKPQKEFESVFKLPSKSIACFNGGDGFLYSTIEGRCQIQFLNDAVSGGKSFPFRCHRSQSDNTVYSVNSTCFNPVFGSFATCGSDGNFSFWDKDAKSRLKSFTDTNPNFGKFPITASAFSEDGRLFAYARGYDWSKGKQGDPNKQIKTSLHLLAVKESDVKTKK